MRQEKISIIITSAGTASAVSVIKALKKQHEIPVHIIAVDVDPMAAGLFLADEYTLVPPASDQNYIPSLIALGKRTSASVLIPIYSKEIRLISEKQALLAENGLYTLLSSPETIDLCNNKRAMYAFAEKAGLCIPKLFDNNHLKGLSVEAFPVFAKPNTGSSSAGAEKVMLPSRLAELIDSGKDLVVQQFIEAEEVTVDVFCNENSEALVVAPRLRLATKAGQSVKGRTLAAQAFEVPVKLICKQLKIRGVCNVQFFLKGENLYFIEVNPRFAAGGLMLTVHSGANIPLILLKYILGIPLSNEECLSKPNFLMTRYWEEYIFEV